MVAAGGGREGTDSGREGQGFREGRESGEGGMGIGGGWRLGEGGTLARGHFAKA